MSLNHPYFLNKLLLLGSFILLSLIPSQAQEIEQNIKKEINKILRYEVEWDKKKTPGFIVVFIEPDTSFTIKFGTEANSNNEIIDNRLFSIGGLSKVYTSIAISHAIQNGTLDTSQKVQDVFPEIYPDHTFSIIDILRHKAGFPRVLKGLQVDRKNEFENISEQEFLSSLPINNLKKEDFLYNHNDYALLETWVKKVTNKSIKEWYKSARQSYAQLPPWRDEFSPTIGLNRKGRSHENISYDHFTSSLGLYATSEELEDLTRFLLEDNSISNFIKQGKEATKMGKNILFSKGLYRISKSKKYTLYGHGGRSANNNASIHFVPETNTGIVILSNSQTGTNPLYLHLISMINNNWKR